MEEQIKLTVLFDFDSLIYKSVYKILSISDIKKLLKAGKSREFIETEIKEQSINRAYQIANDLFTHIEDTGIMIGDIEYYITNAPNSIRRQISPIYKTNRKPNKWVNAIRKYLIEMDFAITHPEFEADDLISDRAKELGENACIILSMDKDLKQIPGIHFNYYRPKVVNEKGEKVSGDCVGLSCVSTEEARYSFWLSMLTGDHGDNIKGIKGIGPKKGEAILKGKHGLRGCVEIEYKRHYGDNWKHEFDTNYRLLGLGQNLFK
jgi:hypothetical protein